MKNRSSRKSRSPSRCDRRSETPPSPTVCHKMGVADAIFYNGKKKYGGLGVSKLRRLKQLEEEKARLKRRVSDFDLDKPLR